MNMPLRKIVWMGLLAAAAAALGACGQNTWIDSGHPLAAPDQVAIYTQRPAKYERLGTVTHLGGLDPQWTTRGDAAPVFNDLLTEAGAMGANGLLVLDDTTMADGSVPVTYRGVPYTLPIHSATKTVIVQAIYVVKQ